MSTISVFTEPFRIRAYEVSPQGHVTAQTLCNYLQEAAGLHAQHLGFAMAELSDLNLTWVLVRLHAQFDAFPGWGEEVHVTTWPSGQDGLYARREYEMVTASGTRVGRGTSAWLLIDIARRRPVRIPDFIRRIQLPARPRPIDDDFPKLPAPETAEHTRTFDVRQSDLDLNAHVNNVHYVEWALESIPPAAVAGRRLHAVEVHFRAETSHGDRVRSTSGPAHDAPATHELEFHHRLVRTADDREVALARTRWGPAEE